MVLWTVSPLCPIRKQVSIIIIQSESQRTRKTTMLNDKIRYIKYRFDGEINRQMTKASVQWLLYIYEYV